MVTGASLPTRIIAIMAMWLASYPDGCLRMSDDGARHHRRLTPDGWFCDLLDGFGEQHHHEVLAHFGGGAANLKASRGDVQIVGLVRLSHVGCCFADGPLTPWTREAFLHWVYHGLPMDAYEVKVQEAAPGVKQPIYHKVSVTQGGGGLGALRLSYPLFHAPWGSPALAAGARLLSSAGDGVVPSDRCDDSGSEMQAEFDMGDREIADRWGTAAEKSTGSDSEVQAADVPMLLMPEPICELVMSGRLHRLLLLTRWHSRLHLDRCRFNRLKVQGPLAGWPPSDSAAWAKVGIDLQWQQLDLGVVTTALPCPDPHQQHTRET